MNRIIAADENINTLYLRVLDALLKSGCRSSPRGMPIVECVDCNVRMIEPARCMITLPDRKLNYHFMTAEFLWMAVGDNRVATIEPYCNEIAKFSDNGETFFGAYGPPWRAQVWQAIELLREDRASRQAVISIWRQNPPKTKDVPCTVAMQYMIRDEELYTFVTMRSWDAWLGMPYDLFNFSRLGAIVAGELGVKQGPLSVNAGSLHLYERDHEKVLTLLEAMENIVVVKPPEHPPLLLPDRVLFNMYMQQAQTGHVGTALEPWVHYLRMLANRHDSGVELSGPFKGLSL